MEMQDIIGIRYCKTFKAYAQAQGCELPASDIQICSSPSNYFGIPHVGLTFVSPDKYGNFDYYGTIIFTRSVSFS